MAELCKAKLEAPKRLREAAARGWREIDDGTLRCAAAPVCVCLYKGAG